MLTIVVIVLAALAPTLVALAALRQGQENDLKASELSVVAHLTALKTEELLQTTAKIHDLTNSNLTAVKSDLAAAIRQIKSLQQLVAALSEGQATLNPQPLTTELDPAMSKPTRDDHGPA